MDVLQVTGVVSLTIFLVYIPLQISSASVAPTNKNSSLSDLEPAASGKKFTIGVEDDDLDGFSKNYGKKGSDSYKNRDKYHKRDGDSYGFSTHGGYSLGDGDGKGGAYHQSYAYDSDDAKSNKGKPSYKEWHYEKKKGQPARRSYYSTGKESSDEDEDDNDDFEFGAESKVSPISMFPSHDVEVMGEMGPQTFLSLDDISVNGEQAKATRAKKQTDYDGYDAGGFDGEPEGGEAGDGADPEYAGYDEGDGADYDYYK